MSLCNFWPGIQGAAGPGFVVGFSSAGWSLFDVGVPPGDARVEVRLEAGGDVHAQRLNGSDGTVGTWVTGSGFDANDYDFQWQSGLNDPNWGPSDPVDVWINGGITIVWGEEETGIGTSFSDGILRIRPAGGGSVIDTATINLEAESTP